MFSFKPTFVFNVKKNPLYLEVSFSNYLAIQLFLSSEAAIAKKFNFFGGAFAAEDLVAVGEAAEASDDFAVFFGEFEVVFETGFFEKFDSVILVL